MSFDVTQFIQPIPPKMASPAQLRFIDALCEKLNVTAESWLRGKSEALLGRKVCTPYALTVRDASKVIEYLKEVTTP